MAIRKISAPRQSLTVLGSTQTKAALLQRTVKLGWWRTDQCRAWRAGAHSTAAWYLILVAAPRWLAIVRYFASMAKGNIKEAFYESRSPQTWFLHKLSPKETPNFWCYSPSPSGMEQNGWKKKLGIFSDQPVLLIPHPCWQAVGGEGQVFFLLACCFQNNTQETTQLASLLLLPPWVGNVGRRDSPGLLAMTRAWSSASQSCPQSCEDWRSSWALCGCLYFATASERTKLCVCKERVLRIFILTLLCIQQGNQLYQVARRYKAGVCIMSNPQPCLYPGGDASLDY